MAFRFDWDTYYEKQRREEQQRKFQQDIVEKLIATKGLVAEPGMYNMDASGQFTQSKPVMGPAQQGQQFPLPPVQQKVDSIPLRANTPTDLSASQGVRYIFNSDTGTFEPAPNMPPGISKKNIITQNPPPPVHDTTTNKPPSQEAINTDAYRLANSRLAEWIKTTDGMVASADDQTSMLNMFYEDALSKISSKPGTSSAPEAGSGKNNSAYGTRNKAIEWLKARNAKTSDANINAVIKSGKVK